MRNLNINKLTCLFVILLILLTLPMLQSITGLIKVKPLKGWVENPKKPLFLFNSWFRGEFQNKMETYLNESFGFRSDFVRLNNQKDYTLFNKVNAKSVIVGIDNYLYEENYIKAYFGDDFIGIDTISQKINKLKFVQDTLNKLDKSFILIFAAGKGSYYPEYIPDKYKTQHKTTNYETYLRLAQSNNINHIDFNKYFIDNKNKSQYELYPKYGIHWSYYGACIVSDSIIKYIEKQRNIDMPNLYWNTIDITREQHTDYDIGDGLNLFFRLKGKKLAYPNIQIQDDKGKKKPSVLVIADSFYWVLNSVGFQNAFSMNHFWFYNKDIYPNNEHSEVSQVNLQQEIANHDIIILLATEATLPNLGWGFIENIYNLYSKK